MQEQSTTPAPREEPRRQHRWVAHDPATARRFFDALYPIPIAENLCTPVWARGMGKKPKRQTLWWTRPETAHQPLLPIDPDDGHLSSWRTSNLYFHLAAHDREVRKQIERERAEQQHNDPRPLHDIRGTKRSAVLLPAMLVDIDCAGGDHAAKNLPIVDDVLEALRACDNPPSCIVLTGGGVHAYWFLDEYLTLDDNTAPVAEHVMRVLAKHFGGDKIGVGGQLARIPGSANLKPGTMRRSEIAHLHPNIRYTFEEMQAWTEELDADHAASPGPRRPWSGRRDDGPPRGSAERIAEECSYIAHCRDDAVNLPEHDWTAMMTVVARCEDGEAVAHAWSSPYPSYSQAETQAKLEHARDEMSPRTCAMIAEEWEGCASCPHKGKIKSPVLLREPPVHETKRAIVDAALSAKDPHAALTTPDVMEALRWLQQRRPLDFLELEPRVRAAVKESGGTLGAFRTALKAAVPPEDRERREQERDAKKAAAIMVSAGLLTEATKQTAHAIRSQGSATHPRVLVYAGKLFEIIDANIEHGTIVQPVGPNRLAVIAGGAAYFAIVNDKGEVEDRDCPERICRALLENPVGYGFAILDGISGVPVLREDGTIWQTPGYDRESRVYFDPQGIKYPVIQDAPTMEEAREAILRVAGYLDEVAFADETAKSVGLCALLTAVARHAFGQAPGFHFDAAQQSSGKTYLALSVAEVAAGEDHGGLTTWPSDEEELRKALMSHALAGRRVVIFDNVPEGTAIDSATLCRFITAPKTYSDRELGHSRTATVSPRITILSTGNNVIPSGDLTSRILPCRLDRGEEHPEEHPYLRDLLVEVRENRGQIVADLLTAIRAYLAAGEPALDIPACRMPGWSRFAREPLVWAGLTDPMDAMAAARDHDPARGDLIDFLEALHLVLRGYEWVTARELLGALRQPGPAQEERTEALEILASWTKVEAAELNPRRIGYALRKRIGRRVGGLRLVTDGDRRGEDNRQGGAPRDRRGVLYRVEATAEEEASA